MQSTLLVTLAVSLLVVWPETVDAETPESLTIEQVALPFAAHDTRMELRWALTRRTYSAKDVLLTVHQGASDRGSYGVFNLYRVSWLPPEPIRYERTLRLETETAGVSHFIEPQLVWAVDESGDRRQVLVVTELVHGSAGERLFSLYEIVGNGEVEPLEFISARQSASADLADDETLCGTGSHDFSVFPFRFSYAINIVGQRPCKVSRGTMTGEYKLVGKQVLLRRADRHWN